MQKVHMKWTKMSILETQMDQEMWNFSHFLRHFSHFLQISKVNDFSSYIFWIVEVSRFQNVPYLLRDILFNLYPGSGTVWYGFLSMLCSTSALPCKIYFSVLYPKGHHVRRGLSSHIVICYCYWQGRRAIMAIFALG